VSERWPHPWHIGLSGLLTPGMAYAHGSTIFLPVIAAGVFTVQVVPLYWLWRRRNWRLVAWHLFLLIVSWPLSLSLWLQTGEPWPLAGLFLPWVTLVFRRRPASQFQEHAP
jgi:hypothetical protein